MPKDYLKTINRGMGNVISNINDDDFSEEELNEILDTKFLDMYSTVAFLRYCKMHGINVEEFKEPEDDETIEKMREEIDEIADEMTFRDFVDIIDEWDDLINN